MVAGRTFVTVYICFGLTTSQGCRNGKIGYTLVPFFQALARPPAPLSFQIRYVFSIYGMV